MRDDGGMTVGWLIESEDVLATRGPQCYEGGKKKSTPPPSCVSGQPNRCKILQDKLPRSVWQRREMISAVGGTQALPARVRRPVAWRALVALTPHSSPAGPNRGPHLGRHDRPRRDSVERHVPACGAWRTASI